MTVTETDWVPKRSEELLSSALDDGTVIVSPSDGKMSVVNEVGAFIWSLVDGQNSVSFIVEQVTGNFEVTVEQAEQDVSAFLLALEERKLVTRSVRASDPES